MKWCSVDLESPKDTEALCDDFAARMPSRVQETYGQNTLLATDSTNRQ